jgi:hypothetical protein
MKFLRLCPLVLLDKAGRSQHSVWNRQCGDRKETVGVWGRGTAELCVLRAAFWRNLYNNRGGGGGGVWAEIWTLITKNFVYYTYSHTQIHFIYLYSNKLHSIVIFYKQHIKTYVLSETLNFSYMFRSLSDHPQGDTIFVLTSVTKIIDAAACLLQCVCWVLSCSVRMVTQ